MAFVKLDCAFLHSSTWCDVSACRVFLTALLLAKPKQVTETKVLDVETGKPTEWSVPSGAYGLVEASVSGLVASSQVSPRADALAALARLCAPELESRSQAFDGRRMARVDGGFLVLNFDAYRKKDHTAAKRQEAWRKNNALRNGDSRYITQVEAEADNTEADADHTHTRASAKAPPKPSVTDEERASAARVLGRMSERVAEINPRSRGWSATKNNTRDIVKRLRDGVTEAELIEAVDVLAVEAARDPVSLQYFTPTTPFRDRNWAQTQGKVNAAGAKSATSTVVRGYNAEKGVM